MHVVSANEIQIKAGKTTVCCYDVSNEMCFLRVLTVVLTDFKAAHPMGIVSLDTLFRQLKTHILHDVLAGYSTKIFLFAESPLKLERSLR